MAGETQMTVVGNLTSDPERFWARVDRRSINDCWPWARGKQSQGYGVYWITRRQPVLAHRAVLMITTGVAPEGAHALHACDNPPCCNPDHLRWGRHVDNMRDMRDRGRARPGRTIPPECSKGHDLTIPENVLVSTRKQNGRSYTTHSCRECNRQHSAKRRAERKSA